MSSGDGDIVYECRRKHRSAFLLRDLGEGGAERSALRLVNGLARDGQDVVLLLFRKKGPLLSAIAPEVEIVDLKGSFLKLLTQLYFLHVDFLLPVYTSMRALLARLILRVLRVSFHVVLSQRNMFTMDRGPVQTRLRFLRCRLLYPSASACVCISQGVAEEMRGLALIEPEKIRVIYNPVLTDELSVQMEAPLDHPWFGGGDDVPSVVLGVGRLGDQKDFATLIRAFGLLASRHPELRLLILGEGRQRAMLEKLVREENLASRVSLPGYVPNPYPYMKRAALFVMTSRFEGFGNVVAEALACGCSIVSTDCKSGPADILDNGKYGYLAKTGDVFDVARLMEEALKHPLPVEELKKRAAFFSERRAVKEYERLFDELKGVSENIAVDFDSIAID